MGILEIATGKNSFDGLGKDIESFKNVELSREKYCQYGECYDKICYMDGRCDYRRNNSIWIKMG